MQRAFNNNTLKFILWDVRNKNLLHDITQWVDYIIHAAALKHITKCEENYDEAISININGTQNIIDVAIANHIKKVLYISTDKAVEPINIYGNTKAISERICIQANTAWHNTNTQFFIVRTGNILWSNGSVLELFFDQIRSKSPITITDSHMRRFFSTMDSVIDLVIYAIENSKGWEIFVSHGDVIAITDLAKIMVELYGDGNEEIIEVGNRNGEKINEVLIGTSEVSSTHILKNGYFIIDKLYNISMMNKSNMIDRPYSTSTTELSDLNKMKTNIAQLFSN